MKILYSLLKKTMLAMMICFPYLFIVLHLILSIFIEKERKLTRITSPIIIAIAFIVVDFNFEQRIIITIIAYMITIITNIKREPPRLKR
ncbi:chromate transport protein ChrA [Paenibacillus eucommiae]|uniref:Chromate transport protein ChrA n=1 Tax=Paenibacillus eucommiae TaxID=1355755 RepID=A0ABS4IM72_9BACL|nr:chromate transport protein ChrA [Paenibacillus eucommiae]